MNSIPNISSLTASFSKVDIGGEIYLKKSVSTYPAKIWFEYEWLIKRQNEPYIATILNKFEQGYFIKYYPYLNLYQTLQKNGEVNWDHLLLNIVSSMKKLHRRTGAYATKQGLEIFVREKFNRKLNDLKKSHSSLLQEIDNIKDLPTIDEISGFLDRKILNQIDFDIELTDCHGDLTFENILVSENFNEFIFIDPNQELILPCAAQDYAKLLQSLWGKYELIKNDDENEQLSAIYTKGCDVLLNILKENFNPKEVLLIQCFAGIHMVRLLPYHQDSATFKRLYVAMLKIFKQMMDEM